MQRWLALAESDDWVGRGRQGSGRLGKMMATEPMDFHFSSDEDAPAQRPQPANTTSMRYVSTVIVSGA